MNPPSRTDILDAVPAGPAAVSLAAGVAGVAGSYAVASFTPSFIAGPIAGLLARRLPAVVVTYSILLLGDLGSRLNLIVALVLSAGLLAVAAGVGIATAERLEVAAAAAPIAGVLAAGVTVTVTAATLPSLAAGVAVALVVAAANLVSITDREAGFRDRRSVLGGVVSAIGALGGGYLLGSGDLSAARPERSAVDDDGAEAEIGPLLQEADEKSLDVPDLEPLVSERFYEVDINTTDPTVSPDDWTLSVTGAVDEEVSYTYDEITGMDAENRFVTLRCVGEKLNARKLDNALWTGVPIMDLVDPAGPADECCVMLHATDGYYQEFPLAALEDGFLAYGMNGETLPRGHGYPARVLIPGHWGEINVKWVTEIEVLDEEAQGYWEERGWHGTGPVKTVAKLHLVEELDGGRVRVGGHAYAGTRGIGGVEVSTDGGETWTDATLSEPLPGEDVWRQWVHAYDAPEGAHDVVVRAIEADGTVQPAEETDPFPSGPSGWVTRTVGDGGSNPF
ncbi:molybdopterin-dependent oxidoreductase [Natronomonas halophila]|uniref:molybdopterin-dependent oxidoreductase n=1 Tax=Natronomonas halophila TaxID=2747817 RepID=UPI0015B6D83C|nr:molybdopterin-dependent oxidoreductase [Natronomonas halophila]QLD86046.1 molybdopterin-dependent oxidoreductase [Natronomonas halophila]